MFNSLPAPPEDALHGVMARFAADKRPDKIDLGVGVYRDATGASPIMRAVTAAERSSLLSQTSKSYLPLRGDHRFLEGMRRLVLGDALEGRLASVQTVGGTGGVRLAIEIAARAKPTIKVLIGTPTWPNHLTICEMLGVEVVTFDYFDPLSQSIQFGQLEEALLSASSGDMLILHGPCHNPSGEDLNDSQLDQIIELANNRGVVLLIDAAYYGLGNDLATDFSRLAYVMENLPQAFLVLSCSKAFGLYRERTGVLFAAMPNGFETELVQSTLERIARGTYSMPPAHGANVVGRILADVELSRSWREELVEMRERVVAVRIELSETSNGDPRLAAVQRQKGIFSLLALSESEVLQLAQEHAIYMPASGRINIAGFKKGDIWRFCDAITRLDRPFTP